MTAASPDTKPPSLWRNRAFNLLWGSQALSGLGSSMSALALPLLTLYVTSSPIKAGLIGTAYAVVRLATQMPSGVVADRVDRRRLMLVCDAVRVFTFGLLGWAVLTDRATLLWIAATVMVAGLFDAASDTAHFSAIRNVVPLSQVPEATARNEARHAAVNLVGPPIGGALFGFARSLPFVADAISFLLSFLGIWLIRKPMQEERTGPREHPVKEFVEGLRFTFSQPFLRAVMLIAPPINLGFNGLGFAIIVILQQRGTPPALIGTAETMIGAGVLCGAIAAGWIVRKVPLRRLAVVATWTAAAVVAAGALLTDSILIAVPMAIAIAFGPALNSALFGYQAAITPDRLQGRVISVIITMAMGLASMSALLAGAFVTWWGGPITILAMGASSRSPPWRPPSARACATCDRSTKRGRPMTSGTTSETTTARTAGQKLPSLWRNRDFNHTVARLAAQLPSGVLADRVNRRRLILTCDTVRLIAAAADAHRL